MVVSGLNLRNYWNKKLKATLVVFCSLFFNFTAVAQTDLPQHFTLDGRLFEPGSATDPLLDSSTVVTIQVLNPAKDCVLYEEEQAVNTLGTNGYFSLRVGSPTGDSKRTGLDRNNSMTNVFYNRVTPINGKTQANANCTYTPAAGEERFFRFFIKPSTASTAVQLSDDMPITSVPQALVAQTLQGLGPSDVFRTSVTSTQAKLDNLLTTQYTNLTDLASGTSTQYLRNDPAGTVLPSRNTNPSSPTEGQIWFDNATNELKYFNGATVETVSNGSGVTSITAGQGLDGGTINSTGTIDLADSGVTTVKLDDEAVTAAKIADSAITTAKVNDGSITDAKLATGIDASKITVNTLPAGVVPTGTDDTKLPLVGGTMTGPLVLGDDTTFSGFDLLGTGHITMSPQKTITIGRYDSTEQPTLIATLGPLNAGAMWFNSSTGKLMYWSGTAAFELSESTSAGGDITAVNTNAGSGLSGGNTSGPITLQVVVDGTTIEIATNTIQLKALGVASGHLQDGAVLTAKIVDAAVTTAKIDDQAVTTAKLDDEAVTTPKLADSSVSTSKLVDTSVTEVKLANSSVSTGKLVDTSVTEVKLADGAVTSAKIADGTITSADVDTINIGKISSAATEYFTYMPNGAECTDGYVLKWTSSNRWECATDIGVTDHGTLTGLGDDDHTQYALLAGRGAGQNLRGGTAASANLTLESTSDTTKGFVILQPTAGNVGIGTTNPQSLLDVAGIIRAHQICDESGLNCKDISSGWGGGGDMDGVTTHATTSGLLGGATSGTADLSVDTDNSTIEISGSNKVQIKDLGVTSAKIADNAITSAKVADNAITSAKINDGAIMNSDINASAAIAWSKIDKAGAAPGDIGAAPSSRTIATSGTSGLSGGGDLTADRSLSVNVDNTTVELNANALRVKDSGITSAKIADGTIVDTDIGGVNVSKINSAATEYFTYMPNGAECTDGYVLKWTSANRWECAADIGVTDHGTLTGLGDDDHTQYAMLAGRTTGQNLRGGTAASANLTLESTSDATKGYVLLQPNGGSVGVGTTAPVASAALQVNSTTKGFLPPRMTTAERTAINSPATGLVVYDTNDNLVYMFNGSVWTQLGASTSLRMCGENENCVGTVKACEAATPDSRATVFSTEYTISYGAWSNSQCGISGTGWHVANFSSCSSGTGTRAGVCRWVLVEVAGGGGGGGGGGAPDNLGNHIAAQTLVMGNNWISGDGDLEGMRINTSGFVGIGTNDPQSLLDVAGRIRAQEICDEAGLNCKDISSGWGGGGDIDGVTTHATNSGLTGGTPSGTADIKVDTDNTTVEISGSNKVQIKNLGVTTAKLADSSVTEVKLANNSVTSAKIVDGTIVNADIGGVNISKINSAATEYFTYMPNGAECTDGYVLKWTSANRWECAADIGVTDHGTLTGLSDDDHTQYAMLAGRTTGQNLRGGTAASANLTLESTSDATKGYVLLQPTGGSVGVGTTAPHASAAVQIDSTTKGFLPPRMTTAQRTAIASPSEGLLVFDTDVDAIHLYRNSAWVKLADTTEVAFDVRKTSNGASSASFVNMNWQSKILDIGCGAPGCFDLANDKFVAPVAGRYLITAQISYSFAGNDVYGYVSIYKNGVMVSRQYDWGHVSSNNPAITAIVDLAVNDEIAVYSYTSTAGIINSGEYTFMQGYLITGGTGGGGGGSADHLGNHTATQSITMANNWLSGDGDPEGVFVSTAGNVGVGTSNPLALLDVAGIIRAEQICDEAGANCKDISTGWSTGVATTRAINTNTGSALTGGGDLSADRNIAVNVDNTGIEINTNALRLKDGGVTSSKIADGTIVNADIAGVNISKINSAATEYFTYMPNGAECTDGYVLKWTASNRWECAADIGVTDHGTLTGLGDDDHTQYALLAGRTTGQNIRGGTAASATLTLDSTVHATKGYVLLNPSGGGVGVGTTAPVASAEFQVNSTTKGFLPPRMTTANRLGISSPAEGLIVFDTDEDFLFIFKLGSWVKLADSTEVSFQAYKTGAQAITQSVYNVITWEAESYDVGGGFDLSTERFQPSVAGKYLVSLRVATSTSLADGSYFQAAIFKNGAEFSTEWVYTGSAGQSSVATTLLTDMNGTTDYIDFRILPSVASQSVRSESRFTRVEGYLISGGTGGGGGGAADHLGNHVATQNLTLASHWLSGDGNNEGLRIDSTGQVGVGTSVPNSLLTVEGAMTLDEIASDFAGAAGYGSIYAKTDGKLYFRSGTGAVTELTADSSTTPAVLAGWPDTLFCTQGASSAAFEIYTISAANVFYRHFDGTLAQPTYLSFNRSTGAFVSSGGAGTQYDATDCETAMATNVSAGRARFFGNDVGSIAQDNDNDTKIMVEKNTDEDKIRFDTAGSERMIISETGRVGIGSTAPNALLDVAGIIRAEQICDEAGANCKDISTGWNTDYVATTRAVNTSSGSALTGGGDLSADRNIAVNVDNVGIEINTNALRLKDSGVTSAKIADGTIVNADIGGVNVGKINSAATEYFTYMPNGAECTDGYVLKWTASNRWECATDIGITDHGTLTGLGDDDHTQYALLSGRTTGQTLRGGTAASASLTLDSTSDSTKGLVLLNPTGGSVAIGTTSANSTLTVAGTFTANSRANTAAYDYVGQFITTNNVGGSNYSRLGFGQVSTNSMFIEAADQANTKGSILLQPYGGTVGIGTTVVPSVALHVVGHAASTGAVYANYSGAGVLTMTGYPSGSTLTGLPGGGSDFAGRILGPANGHMIFDLRGNDANDGFYFRVPANPVADNTPDTVAMAVRAGGNVGIGTITPSRTLDVSGTISVTSSDSYYTTSSWGRSLELPNGGSVVWKKGAGAVSRGIGKTTDDKFYVMRSTADDNSAAVVYDLVVDGSGNVGIGTIGPVAAVHVTKPVPMVYVQDSNDLATANSVTGYMSFRDSANTEYGWVGDGSAADNHIGLYDSRANGKIILGTNGAERLTIDSVGKVGIGAAPSSSYMLYADGSGTAYGGVFGYSGTNTYGVVGRPSSTTYGGVLGYSQNASFYGILGHNNAYSFYGVGQAYSQSGGGSAAIYGNNTGAHYGVYGLSAGSYGVYGVSNGSNGVVGVAGPGYHGVVGYNNGQTTYGSLGYGPYSLYGNSSAYVAGTYQGSDRRLKDNITKIENGLDVVSKLRPVTFTWKPGSDQANAQKLGSQPGFIAQEVKEVLPGVVKEIEAPQMPDKNGKLSLNQKLKKFFGVEYESVIPYLTSAIQELYAKFLGHDKEITALKAQNKKLEERLNAIEKRAPASVTPPSSATTSDETARLKSENAQMREYLCAKDPRAPFCKTPKK